MCIEGCWPFVGKHKLHYTAYNFQKREISLSQQLMTNLLRLASHPTSAKFWEGGNYELNMTFNTLRDKHWMQVMQAVWGHPLINGPLGARYFPDHAPEKGMAIQVPPPTATLNQHGQIAIDGLIVGCDIQATRSLFECVSVLVPVGMFADTGNIPHSGQQAFAFPQIDNVFLEIAMAVYQQVPFEVAAIGYERSCQLPSELQNELDLRHNFLVAGNFLIREEVLEQIDPDLSAYQEVRPKLRYLPPR
jgi:hypothetical protein